MRAVQAVTPITRGRNRAVRLPRGGDGMVFSRKIGGDGLTAQKAQLWINHDKAQRDSLKLAPDFYE